MHLEIEMVDAMSARFCSQFIVSLFGGTSTWQVQDRGKMELKTKKQSEEEKEASRSPKITKKPKKQFGNRTGKCGYFSSNSSSVILTIVILKHKTINSLEALLIFIYVRERDCSLLKTVLDII